MTPSDQEIIARFRSGDDSAFEELVRRWSPELLRLAHRLTGDADEARDLRQAALLRAYDTLPNFDGRARPTTWLYRVVVNLSRDRHRREAVRRRADAVVAEHNGHAGDASNPARLAEAEETARRVADAVAALPEAEREVIALRHYQGLPFPAVAEVLEVPVTTIKSRMARGLLRLRTLLKDLQPR